MTEPEKTPEYKLGYLHATRELVDRASQLDGIFEYVEKRSRQQDCHEGWLNLRQFKLDSAGATVHNLFWMMILTTAGSVGIGIMAAVTPLAGTPVMWSPAVFLAGSIIFGVRAWRESKLLWREYSARRLAWHSKWYPEYENWPSTNPIPWMSPGSFPLSTYARSATGQAGTKTTDSTSTADTATPTADTIPDSSTQ